MSENQKKNLSRRSFFETSVMGATGMALLPGILTSSQAAAATPAADVRLGFIGLGRQAMFLLNGFIQIPGVDVIAGCDVYGIKRKRFEKRVNAANAKNGKKAKALTFEKFEDLLKNPEINAVVIAIPDHSHARIAIAALKAGKEVYLEKPMTFTIKEGQELVKVVREHKRILGIGSMQRSDANFQYAIKLVHSGAIGAIEKVNAYVGAPPKPYNLPEEALPTDLNWDMWLGSLTAKIHFNHELDPPIKLDPEVDEDIWGAWRWYTEMGGGFTTDWGAHMFDIAQWGLKMDKNGPVEISPIGDGTEYMTFKYANGVVMTSEPFDEKMTKGVKFWGKKGWIEVARGYFNASDPKLMPAKKEEVKGSYETNIPHQVNFVEAVRAHKDPVVPVEIGHSSCTVCTLGNIACQLHRTIKWDPIKQVFVDDKDGAATKMMHYEYRKGYSLL